MASNTKIIKSKNLAVKLFKQNKIIAFPTETVYGLGFKISSPELTQEIFNLKKRPDNKPLTVHIGNLEQLKLCVSEINKIAEKLIEKFLPGPLTLILNKTSYISDLITCNSPKVGIRMPAHKLLREIISEVGEPIVGTSLNISGEPAPVNFQEALSTKNNNFINNNFIEYILDLKTENNKFQAEFSYKQASTVYDCSDPEELVILRQCPISREQIQDFLKSKYLSQESLDYKFK